MALRDATALSHAAETWGTAVCLCTNEGHCVGVLMILWSLWPDEVFIGTDKHSNAVLVACPTYIRSGRVGSVLSQVCVGVCLG